jgi:hypothetical protein
MNPIDPTALDFMLLEHMFSDAHISFASVCALSSYWSPETEVDCSS